MVNVVARSRLVSLALATLLAGCSPSAVASPSNSGLDGSPGPSRSALPSIAASPTPGTTPSAVPAPPATGQIAYIRGPVSGSPDGTSQVWVVDVASGAERQLTSDATFKSTVLWLNDGSRLAYAWYGNGDPYHDTLSTILPDGSGKRDLGSVQTIYDPAALSPDRRTIAWGGDGSEDGNSGIVLLDLVTGARRMLTHDGAVSPIWSPDGTRILAALLSRRVLVIDATTGATLASITDDGVQGVLGWTADGASVIWDGCGNTKDSCASWAAKADGSSPKPYTGAVPDRTPSWLSPDGRWRAEVRESDGVASLFAGGVGSQLTQRTGTLNVGGVSWSPDGQWLAFGGWLPAGDTTPRIYLVPRSGGIPTPVTSGPDEAPAWRPAGS